MAQLDRYTIDHLGLDGKILMSSAARETLRVIRQVYPAVRKPVIFAGTGNNGGDGVALAYYAQQDGMSPLLVLCHPEIADPPRLSEDSDYYYRIAQRAYVATHLLDNPALAPEVLTSAQCDMVIDALFGTGLDRALGDYHSGVVERINHTSQPLLAVDCPSGLNCTTGQVMGTAVEADLTVTMGFPKRGFYHPAAGRYLGDLHVAPLGFAPPSEAAIDPECHAWPDALWEPLRMPRAANTHKGDYGRLLIVAGHRRYPGAPRLAAAAAVRCGAGLVRLVVPEDVYPLAGDQPSVMVDSHPTDGLGGFNAQPSPTLLEYIEWADALVLGPGLSDAPGPIALAQRLLTEGDLPVVLDADALRALPVETAGRSWPLVLTPHVGELARLAGVTVQQAEEQWFTLSAEMARVHDALLLAKSNQCLLTLPEGAMIFPQRGHPALASGGTGDVLSGIVGALLARLHAQQPAEALVAAGANGLRLNLAEVVTTAVNIHSQAARLGVEQLGEESLSAADLVDEIPGALKLLATSGGQCEKWRES